MQECLKVEGKFAFSPKPSQNHFMKKIFVFSVAWLMAFSVSAQSGLTSDSAADILLENLGLATASLPESVTTTVTKSTDGSEVVRVTLNHSGVGQIRLLLKGEPNFFRQLDRSFRSAVLVSGFFTGEDSVHLLGQIPGVVLVGFEYPYGVEDFQKDPGSILQFVRLTPGQIALALRWISLQPWSDPRSLSIVAVSLGGVFVPAGLKLTQRLGVQVAKTIFICTGADLHSILELNLRPFLQPWLLGPVLSLMTAPMILADPKLHLPDLTGSFLVIQTTQDTVIPRTSQQVLYQLLRDPKKEILLEGPHINSDQTDLIRKIQNLLLQEF